VHTPVKLCLSPSKSKIHSVLSCLLFRTCLGHVLGREKAAGACFLVRGGVGLEEELRPGISESPLILF